MRLYKIFEVKPDGRIMNLFHGFNGSREVKIGVEYKNEDKLIRDGGNNNYYKSGIHAHYSPEFSKKWLKRFDSTNRKIFEIEGFVRENKATSDGKVALCSGMIIIKEYKG